VHNKSIASDSKQARKEKNLDEICIMMACEKGESLVLQTWHWMVEFSNAV
jgi:hypothetical protein